MKQYLTRLGHTRFLLLMLLSASQAGAQTVAEHIVSAGGIDFTLPVGVAIEKVAGEPLIKWPIAADWDDLGRLVVAESGGVGWPIQEHNQQRLHRIVRLVDSDGDGRFDQRIVAAQDLAFPEGVLCLGQDILVAAPPVIWRLVDEDDDGVCERREIWFDGATITNCANDLHGPYLGRDGWIYWCKGAFGKQRHDLVDGRTLTSTAAHVYRRRLAGGPIEPLVSGGMDNPVEVAMTPEGEKFFTSTFLVHPGNGQRDGIAHAIYGGVFGKDHHVIDDLTRTGPLLQPMTHLGPAAPSGLICAESQACKTMIGGHRDSRSLLAASFNLHKLTVHELVGDGATYHTLDRDLVSTERVDFHPTDVIEDADGSLLLIDTGGWYDLCCPSSRVDQKTAAGGVYRISKSRRPAERIRDAAVDWNSRDPDDLVALLFDGRPWIRRQAAFLLQSIGNSGISSLIEIASDPQQPLDRRQAAIWGLCRIETPQADMAVAQLLRESPASLKLTACHVMSIHRVAAAGTDLEALLNDESPLVQRAAAEALGRIGNAHSLHPLMQRYDSSQGIGELAHSLLYALIEMMRRDDTIDLMGVADTNAKLNAAFIVLQQTGNGDDIEASRLFAALSSGNNALRRTAAEILSRNPQLGADAGGELATLWDGTADSQAILLQLLVSWRNQPAIAVLVDDWIANAIQLPDHQQHFIARNLSQLAGRPLGEAAADAIANWLEAAEPQVREQILDELAEVGAYATEPARLTSVIQQRAAQTDRIGQRLRWLRALPAGHVIEDPALEHSVLEAFLSDDTDRTKLAAKVLRRVRLNESLAGQLTESLADVSPRDLIAAIDVVYRSGNDPTRQRLLEALPSIPAARTLPDGFLVNLFKDASNQLRQQAESSARELIRPVADVQASVSKTLAGLGRGDPVRGLQIFRGSKAACSGCHRMGYIGNNIGPELTRIGASRTRESLLEAILFPNSRLEQSYQSTQILTIDGKLYNGLVQDRRSGTIQLQLAADRLINIEMDQIELEKPSNISIMPTGIVELLTPQELADLLALLEAAN